MYKYFTNTKNNDCENARKKGVCSLDKYVINGGHPLNGEVTISGAKNAVAAIIPATILVKGKCYIENVPDIRDVSILVDTLNKFGAIIEKKQSTLMIDCTNIERNVIADFDDLRKIRASYYLLGALLGRFSKAIVSMPGGCDFGARPIDQHIKGFEMLGASVDMNLASEIVTAYAEKLTGARVYLDIVSVGATINIMLAATGASGLTIIENAAKEPHVVDVANFLNTMGADIKGAGTDVIKIKGGRELIGGTYAIIPDQIEAGTYMVATGAVGGEVRVKNVIPKHLESISAKLREAGVEIIEEDDSVLVRRNGRLNKISVKTLPHPGFPTDMQPQIATMLCLAKGASIVTESVFDHRFKYTNELIKLGAELSVSGKTCYINGVASLHGGIVHSCDLRAGVAMIIAGLMVNGTTEVLDDGCFIARGYENLIEKFGCLGADITKVSTEKACAEGFC